MLNDFIFKIAEHPWEIEAVHALNYATFVEEIPQHKPNTLRKLVDKFHNENTYIICVHEQEQILAGMIAFRSNRPFSLDEKLANLDSYLPTGHRLCEARLLAVDKAYRYTRLSQLLIAQFVQFATDLGHDLAVISGTVRQAKLYKFLGCVPFGPLVGTEEAKYQPMYLTLQAFSELTTRSRSFAQEVPVIANDEYVVFNFMPGPVDLCKGVLEICGKEPCSHRSDSFIQDFQRARALLCQLTQAYQVEIMMGSGTLANDAIAGQLSLLRQTGLILVSGEFGRRLVKHASGAKLPFRTLEIEEGHAFQSWELEKELNRYPEIQWIWGTHCETSTGVLNDLEMYKAVCENRGIKLCMDCVSSIGTVPLDLSGVFLASGTSGKGLASIAGLSLVFHDHDLEPNPDKLPCILDLGHYQLNQGIPFTIQSNLVYALIFALQSQNWEQRFENLRDWSKNLRRKLAEIKAPVLAEEKWATPSVATIALPAFCSSRNIGDILHSHGVLLSYNSGYLIKSNWIQVCMMGAEQRPTEKLVRLLKKELSPKDYLLPVK